VVVLGWTVGAEVVDVGAAVEEHPVTTEIQTNKITKEAINFFNVSLLFIIFLPAARGFFALSNFVVLL